MGERWRMGWTEVVWTSAENGWVVVGWTGPAGTRWMDAVTVVGAVGTYLRLLLEPEV